MVVRRGRVAASGRRKSDGKRRAIIDGACRVFLAQGFGGANMDAVAAAARVSKMTVYRYFPSKEQLFAGVVRDMCDRIIDPALVEAMRRVPLRDALRMFGRHMHGIIFAPDTLGLHRIVVAETQRFPDLGKLFYDSGPGGSIRALAEHFARHRRDPALKIKDPRLAAEEFLELLRGYDHMRALLRVGGGPSPRRVNQRVERAIEHVLR
jgi:TetR/AcrR family transcriptional regulator, mexJK operon transcriptional repressor